MMRYLKVWLVMLLTLVVAACGGGGNPGSTTPVTTAPVATTVTSIELLASSTTLDSADSTTGVTITAVAKNASNVGVPSQAVAFAASSGVLGSVTAASNSQGNSTAVLTTGSDHSNRSITVTATVGTVSKSIVIDVSGSSVTISGSASLLLGATSTFSVTLKDSAGKAISGSTLTVTSTLGNAITPAALTTNSAGAASFSYVASKSGNDVVTVSGAGATATYPVVISSTNFAFITPADGTSIPIGASQVVAVQLLPAVAGQSISFSSTRGLVTGSPALTNASGIASATVSSTTAGAANVTAQAPNSAQTRRAVSFVADVASAASVVLQTNVSAIAPNAAGSSTNGVILTATVKDANSNVVQGATVNFSLLADTSGGYIGSGTGVTNANGVVTDTFIPGASSTAANGVQIMATIVNTSLSNVATVTVNTQALFITIATSNTIANLDPNTYSKPFSVYLTDANGAPVASKEIILSVYPLYYIKGELVFSNGSWGHSNTDTVCVNEDANRDGIMQGTEDDGRNVGASTIVLTGAGNGDGVLTPGLPGFVSPSSITTDSTGLATFNLNYGEQYAPWLYFEIKARASVSGTESSKIYYFSAAGVASDFTNSTLPPAGVNSPFGLATNCKNPD
ncbi:beta strand repeat-containing protein [Rhodoferax sp. WC2427]|uniref:beta strand repeat-containing protein n=1 Tax=Rhodoferax sp. WC2427 TaxID=3234144 RepID=UPI003467124A